MAVNHSHQDQEILDFRDEVRDQQRDPIIFYNFDLTSNVVFLSFSFDKPKNPNPS